MALSKGFSFMDDINFGEPLIRDQKESSNINLKVEESKNTRALNNDIPESTTNQTTKNASVKEKTEETKNASVAKVAKNKTFSSNKFIEDLNVKSKKRKSVQKSFLITEEINNELKNNAKALGVSENELLNEILRKVFNI